MDTAKANRASSGNDVDPAENQHTVVGPSGAIESAPRDPLSLPNELGSYRLRTLLGEGGLGRVFLADAPKDRQVAIKVLHPHLTRNAAVMRRFRKEARMLAEVRHPQIVEIIEIGEHQGFHFLALEYVAGPTLQQILVDKQICPDGRMPEPIALMLIGKIAQALAAVHRRGIVHRDLKPENIMFTAVPPRHLEDWLNNGVEVKICDFGLARQVVQSESLHMTREGMPLGTYMFMAPEQAAGRAEIDQRADVYSLGATLFSMLAGRPPFMSENGMAIVQAHVNEPAPPVRKYNSEVTEATSELIARILSKAPRDRPADGDCLADEVRLLLAGEPASTEAHPVLPSADPARVYDFDWTFELESPPDKLWPFVANTDRVNRAVGVPPVDYHLEVDDAGLNAGTLPDVKRFGVFRKAGVTNAWREFPFEWIEGKRLGVLREYSQGVFEWFSSTTEMMSRAGGGTTLRHRVRVLPRGLLGKFVATVEIGFKGKRRVENVYRRIDAYVAGKLSDEPALDAFELPTNINRSKRKRLDAAIGQLVVLGIEPETALRFADFLSHAPTPEVSRIRPLVLARRLGVAADQAIACCLHSVHVGLLELQWDILCPVCRTGAAIKDTLQALRDHDRCPACNLDFAVDFARSVEMVFRVHKQIREVETKSYCVGGPRNFPHIVAQVRIAAGETIKLDLHLGEGVYRVTSPQLPHAWDIRVALMHHLSRARLNLLRPGIAITEPIGLRSDTQQLVIENQHQREIMVRVERTIPRDDVLTAAKASALAVFRELFPDEVLSAGQLVTVAAMTFLAAEVFVENSPSLYGKLGDARGFAATHVFHRYIADAARQEHGVVIRSNGESVLAAFIDSLDALRAACAVVAQMRQARPEPNVRFRLAIHRGPVLAATLNHQLDYFGETVAYALRATQWLPRDSVGLTSVVRDDERIAASLAALNLTMQPIVSSPSISVVDVKT